MNKQYIGDSVYVDYDRNSDHIVLTTENGLPNDPSNTIYIEPSVWFSLVAYVDKLKAEQIDLKNL